MYGYVVVIKHFSFRFSQWLLLASILLLLSGCGTSAPTQNATRAYPATTPVQRVLPTKTDETAENLKVQPIRLLIPSIQVNATIEALSILPSGELAAPVQSPWENVGWYDAGPRPGERGSAVIDGHLDRPGGYPAVFWNLRFLHAGDKVMVSTSTGKTLNFSVLRIAYYTPQAAPIQEIFGDTSGTYLNLITCAGDWIPSQHQTTLRLVVYTSLLT